MSTATLQGPRTYFFNVDPNSITWTCSLNTKAKETFGGKVIQILSENWDSLTVDFETGGAGREGLRGFADFAKEAVVWQRDTKTPLIFSYPPRGYVFSCFLETVSIKDDYKNVSFPFSFKAKIQRDITGVARGSVYALALKTLTEGVGWSKNVYTYNGSSN